MKYKVNDVLKYLGNYDLLYLYIIKIIQVNNEDYVLYKTTVLENTFNKAGIGYISNYSEKQLDRSFIIVSYEEEEIL